MKAYDEDGNLLDPADFGEEDYVLEGLEQGADYVISFRDWFPVPPEFCPIPVMPGEDFEARKRETLEGGSICRVWDLTRGVIGAPPPTVTLPPEPPAAAEPNEALAQEEPPGQYEAPREFIHAHREAEHAEEPTKSDETDEERALEAAQGPAASRSLLMGWLAFSVAVVAGSAAHHAWGNFGAGPEGTLVFGLIGGGFGCGYAAGFLTSSMWPRS